MGTIVEDAVTQIWAPPEPDIVADLCFIHGLGGHPQGTWTYSKSKTAHTSRKGPSSLSARLFKPKKKRSSGEVEGQSTADVGEDDATCFWPLDLVPHDFDNVRILTYGYDSHSSHFYMGGTNQMTITQHAQQLLQKLTNVRVECRGRPIIFVAHSLGGILVKDTIIQSGKYEDQPKFLDLSQCTFVIVFFGAPHQGANAARYGEMLSNIVGSLPGGPSIYKELLRGLKPSGEKLSNINADFNSILNKNVPAREKIQIYSFQESKAISSIKGIRWKDIEQVSFIGENHMNMCRFKSASTAGYMDFKAALRGYLNDIKAKTGQIVARDRTESKSLEDVEREALKQCLDFKERLIRQQQIDSLISIEETFECIWSSPFATWLKSNSPLFWISGFPASGKSTLMSHIAHSSTTLEILGQAHGAKWQMIEHFFDFRANTSIGNNIEGLLRSILFQILSKDPSLLSRAPEFKSIVDRPLLSVTPSIKAMHGAIKHALSICSTRLFVLLDGLDEYDGQKVELVTLIKSLGSDNVKLCVACRPDPPFSDAFRGVDSFVTQKLNGPGIRKFASQNLQDFFSLSLDYDNLKLQEMAAEIAYRSNGVFLWARFAIFELVEGLPRGEVWDSEALLVRLEQVPLELADVYSLIFRREAQRDREIAGLILLLVSAAQKDLEIGMLREAIESLPSDLAFIPNATVRSLRKDSMTQSSFLKAILATTGGSIEATTPFSTTTPSSSEVSGSCSDSEEVGRGGCVGISEKPRHYGESDADCYSEECDRDSCSDNVAGDSYPNKGEGLSFSREPSNDNSSEEPETFIRLSHRTVEGYCNLRGWKELLGEKFFPGLAHDVWLQICMQVYHSACWNSGHTRSIDTARLGDYALRFLPVHAGLFEHQSQKSTFPFLSTFLCMDFVKAHRKLVGCYYCSNFWFEEYKKLKGLVHEPIHLAVAHGLLRFVEDWLCRRVNGMGQEAPHVGIIAILCASKRPASYWTMNADIHDQILQTVAKTLPWIDGMDIIIALTRFSPIEIQDLLESCIPGKISLKVHDMCEYACLPGALWKREEQYGPLHFIVDRVQFEAETPAILDILLDRGEDINDMCGPLGSVLHSYLEQLQHNSWSIYRHQFVELLIEKGLDVNRPGASGNALEYLWQIANSDPLDWHGSAIRNLIDLGSVNHRQDPNGLVPSVDEMREFDFWEGKKLGEYLESHPYDTDAWRKERARHYNEGPLDSACDWSDATSASETSSAK